MDPQSDKSFIFSGYGDGLTMATVGKASRFTLVANDVAALSKGFPALFVDRIDHIEYDTAYHCIDRHGHANYCKGAPKVIPWNVDITSFGESQPNYFLVQYRAATQSGLYNLRISLSNISFVNFSNIPSYSAVWDTLSILNVLPGHADKFSEIIYLCPLNSEKCLCPSGFQLIVHMFRSYCSPCAKKSACLGQIASIAAGELQFKIAAIDFFGNRLSRGGTPFASVALQPNGLEKALTLQPHTNGDTIARLDVTQAGQYTINVVVINSAGSSEILGSPLVLAVQTADLSPASSSFDAPVVFTAGQVSAFRIRGRDIYGNTKQSKDCSEFLVGLVPTGEFPTMKYVTCRTAPDSTGSCQAVCAPRSVGILYVSVAFVNLHLDGSPLRAEVLPGITCASKSVLFGPGLSIATAGQAGSIMLLARDYMSNPKLLSDDQFIGTLSGPSRLAMSTTASERGMYQATYLVTCAGRYRVSMRLGGIFDTGGVLPELVVWPAAVCAAAGIARGDGLTLATASIQGGFVIMARDQFGNYVQSALPPLQVTLGNLSLGSFDADSSSKFSVRYTVFKSGFFNMSAYLGKWPIISNTTTAVLPAPARSLCASATGTALTLRTAGVKAIFTVVSRDCFGQQRSLDHDQAIAVQSSTGSLVGRLAATYYEGVLEDPILPTEYIDELDFSSHVKPTTHNHRNWVSARWSGRLWIPAEDTYTFYMVLKEQSERVRMWLDSVLLIDMVLFLQHVPSVLNHLARLCEFATFHAFLLTSVMFLAHSPLFLAVEQSWFSRIKQLRPFENAPTSSS